MGGQQLIIYSLERNATEQDTEKNANVNNIMEWMFFKDERTQVVLCLEMLEVRVILVYTLGTSNPLKQTP
jgi:hypothetical protein